MKKAQTAASSSVVRSINIPWRDIGSSYLMSDLQAAYLWAQLEAADRINQQRLALWQKLLRCVSTSGESRAYRAAVDSRWLRAERAYVLH